MNKFSTLDFLSSAISILGWLIAAGGLVLIVKSLNSGGTSAATAIGAGTLGWGAMVVLGAGAVRVLLAIETNTRRDEIATSQKG